MSRKKQKSLLAFGFGNTTAAVVHDDDPVAATSSGVNDEEDDPPHLTAVCNNPVPTASFSATGEEVDQSNLRKVLEPKDTVTLLNGFFGESDCVHSATTCSQEGCRTIGQGESQRFGGKDRFQHDWIFDKKLTCCHQTGYRWLLYVEGQGMFCLICRKHDTANSQNKSKKFNCEGAIRFKRKAVEDHANSNMHKEAINKELLSRGSSFHKEIIHKKNIRREVYFNAFKSAYWIAKEEISNRKFARLINLLEDIGLNDMKYFEHRSDASVREIFLVLGQIIKEQVTENVRQVSSFGLLLDEVSDITLKEQLVMFVQFVDPVENKAEVRFLSSNDLLLESTSANAETMKNVVVQQLNTCGLDIQNVSGVASDGASVMLGRRTGLTTRLKTLSSCIIPVHCICHRLALACGDANDEVSYIKKVENILINLWKFFDNSPKRTSAYAKAVEATSELSKTGKETARGSKSKKIKKAVRTRWLSTQNSISGVFTNYHALTQTLRQLKQEGDPTAIGLLSQVGNTKFLGGVYLLSVVLPILGHLSRAFQKGTFSFASIGPAIQFTVDSLGDVASEQMPLKQLEQDLSEGGRLAACDISLTEHCKQLLTDLTRKYVTALTENINSRFEDSVDVLTAFRIFDPCAVPGRSSADFKTYGVADVKVLGNHFFQMLDVADAKEKTEELVCEWQKFKYNLLDIKRAIPAEISNPPKGTNLVSKSPTEWLLEKILSMRSTYLHFMPCLLQIMEVCLSLPVSNAWPERGASALKRIKTRLRNRLNQDMLEALLHISINGPESDKSGGIVEIAVDRWQNMKARMKLKPIYRLRDKTRFSSTVPGCQPSVGGLESSDDDELEESPDELPNECDKSESSESDSEHEIDMMYT